MSQRAFANAAAFAVVIWLNGLAGSGSLSGESIGILANRYPSAFLPANYVFGIWGLIYASLAAFVLYQFLARGADGAVTRIGWWWVLSCVLNVAWIVTFAFSRFAAAMTSAVTFVPLRTMSTSALSTACGICSGVSPRCCSTFHPVSCSR